MTNNKTNNSQNRKQQINAAGTMQQLIRISHQLVQLAENETQALVQQDMLAFAIMQHEKEKLAEQYTAASEQFRTRIEEFRNVDRNLLTQLETLQKTLAEKTQGNNAIIENIKSRAQQNTQQTLITVQELAQIKPVRIDSQPNTQEGAQK